LRDIRRAKNFVGHHEVDHTDTRGSRFVAHGGDLIGSHKPQVDQDIYQIVIFLSHNYLSTSNTLQAYFRPD
jgi:hypothetical protein